MEEVKATVSDIRTKEQIDAEYSQYAVLLGDRQFKISMLQLEAHELHNKMVPLLKEAQALGQIKKAPDPEVIPKDTVAS